MLSRSSPEQVSGVCVCVCVIGLTARSGMGVGGRFERYLAIWQPALAAPVPPSAPTSSFAFSSAGPFQGVWMQGDEAAAESEASGERVMSVCGIHHEVRVEGLGFRV